jgi:hypothetical protein
MRRTLLPAALACLLSMITASTGFAQSSGDEVDLELVLAADGSGSIDEEEFRLQRAGYASAITDPDVLSAIQGGRFGRIALAYMEWGAPESQETIVDWMVISDLASAQAFADKLLAAPRVVWGYNSISNAIIHANTMIATNRWDPVRKIIDISGDGPQINGEPLGPVRDEAMNQGITINALVIKTPGGGFRGPFGMPLIDHYRQDVIGGFGAFAMVAESREEFALAIRNKMIQEIALR